MRRLKWEYARTQLCDNKYRMGENWKIKKLKGDTKIIFCQDVVERAES